RTGRAPPRPQALERADGRRAGRARTVAPPDHRPRAGHAPRRGRGGDPDRVLAGLAPVHGAGTSAARPGPRRRAVGPLRPRRHPLRDAHRTADLSLLFAGGAEPTPGPGTAGGPAASPPAGFAGRPGDDLPDMPRAGSLAALSVGRGPARRPAPLP